MTFPDTVLRIDSIDVVVEEPTISDYLTFPITADVIVLLGHADGDLDVMTPYPVRSVEKAIRDIGSDNKLANALRACWSAGGRYIMLIKIGETSTLDALDTDEYWQEVYDKTSDGLDLIKDIDQAGIVVPVDARYEGHTYDDGGEVRLDFVALLAEKCAISANNNVFVQGIIGTESDDPAVMLASRTLSDKYAWQLEYCYTDKGWVPFNDMYRFVSVAAGRGKFFLRQLDASFDSDLAATVAGLMASIREDVAISGRIVFDGFLSRELTKAEADDLSVNGLIPFGSTIRRKRKNVPEMMPLSDQNLGVHTSDFQQNSIMRLARRVSMSVKQVVRPLIGTNGLKLDDVLSAELSEWYSQDIIRDFNYRIAIDPLDPYKRKVLLELKPYFSTKIIRLNIDVGPFGG